MQNQKTQPVQVEDLPDIAENHLYFAKLLAEGKTQSDAYRMAINPNIDDKCIWASASRLANQVNVKLWVDALKLNVLNATSYSMEMHIAELEEARQLSKNSGNMGAMVNATVAKGKATGKYIDRVEHINTVKTHKSLEDKLSKIIGQAINNKLHEEPDKPESLELH